MGRTGVAGRRGTGWTEGEGREVMGQQGKGSRENEAREPEVAERWCCVVKVSQSRIYHRFKVRVVGRELRRMSRREREREQPGRAE